MKKLLVKSALICGVILCLTSCYTVHYSVGKGAQKGIELTEKNHFLIYGLAPVKTADPTKMAGDATNYDVIIQHTFIDGLINGLTFGIYTPTTTKIIK